MNTSKTNTDEVGANKVSIKQFAADFAKQNKVSKTKALEFAQAVAAMSKPVHVGRAVSDESKRIRDAIRNAREELKEAGVFTAKELAEKLGTEPVTALNNLKFLMKNEGFIVEAGKKAKEKGSRGRQELLWSVA